MHGTPAIDQASNDIGAARPTGAEAALTTVAGHLALAPIFCHLSTDRLKEKLANH